MGNTVKTTFTIPNEIVEMFVEVVPMKERSKTVAKMMQEYALSEKRKKAIDDLFEFAKTLKWKTKKTAVQLVREARSMH